LQAIGRSFNRYHATALHSINAVERGLKEKGPMQKQVEFLCKKIEEGKFKIAPHTDQPMRMFESTH
jgi:chromosomal replication initiator protein